MLKQFFLSWFDDFPYDEPKIPLNSFGFLKNTSIS
jgi:hypothetical protein